MVFFNCNACGEALKKNQVEKHCYQCRRCEVLSCVDCGKEFWGDDYQQHTKCISEEEKYSGKDYKPKPNANKGEAKQEAWIEQVQQAINKPGINPRLKNVLESLETYGNIPRKKAKFENFVRNSLRIREEWLITQVWEVMTTNVKKPETNGNTSENKPSEEQENGENGKEVEKKEETIETTEPEKKKSKREKKEERQEKMKKKKSKKSKTEEEEEAGEEKPKKKRKRKRSESEEENVEVVIEAKKSKKKKKAKQNGEAEQESDPVEEIQQDALEEEEEMKKSSKFDWEGVIESLLKSASDNELPIKKLKKKVLSAYSSTCSKTYINDDQLLSKFNKKVNKNPKFKVHKERVKLR